VLERILRFSIAHRYLVVLLTLGVAVLGVLAALRLPMDAVPDITNNQVVINTRLPALSPLEIEKRVTTPIEQELAGIPGLERTWSHSRNGFSQVTAVFEDGVDVYFARQQVAERLVAVKERLPAGAGPELAGMTTGLGDVYVWALEFEHHGGKGAAAVEGQPGRQPDGAYLTPEGERLTSDYERAMYLRTVQDWVIRPRIRTVKEVADVDTTGGYVKQYHVKPDPQRLAAYGLTLKDLIDALERNHTSAGAGYVEHKGEAYTVRFSGQVGNVATILQIPITRGGGGSPVRISDVATVGLGSGIRYGAASCNGQETVMGVAQMLVGANSRTVAHAVEREVRRIEDEKRLPPDVRIRTVLSRTKLVDSTIRTVFTNLAEGALLVVVVLFVLLGNFRAAFITALAIPLSMAMTAMGMFQGKISGNLMSLGAIDFGLIVDGAVIIVENCLRRLGDRQRELGRTLTRDERLDVVFQASRQVRTATAFGEAIIIIVYLPILALVGVAGKMYRPMALTVVVALASAFVLSLTFVPAMVAIVIRGRVKERENWLMRIAGRAYAPVLGLALKARVAVVLIAVGVFVACGFLAMRLDSDFVPKLDEGDLLVMAHRAPSVGLAQALKIQAQIEEAVLKLPEIELVASQLGVGEQALDAIPMYVADTYVILKPRDQWPDRHKSKDDLAKEVEKIVGLVPATMYEMSQPIEDRFNDMLSGISVDVGVRILGEDIDKMMPAAQKVFDILRDMKGRQVTEPKGLEGQPMMTVVPDRAAIARYGLSVADVQDVVTVAVGGRAVGVIYEGDRTVELVVRLGEESRHSAPAISSLPVPLPAGDAAGADANRFASVRTGKQPDRPGYVSLSSVARIEVSEGPNDIEHENGTRGVTVTCNLPLNSGTTSFVAELNRRIDKEVRPLLPSGNYSVYVGGQYQTIVQTWQRLAVVIPVGLFLVLVMLFTTFNSMKHALIVFSGVPLALSGGVAALWLRDIHLSISAGVGFIALSGVAVLNGLVMVTFINQLRREGMPLDGAIRHGSLTRLRPVLMTALVASLGFIPMAIATGAGAEVQRPLATVVIGGIVSSTFLTLVVLPALYRMVHRRPKAAPTAPVREQAVTSPA
jgi:cobalt-zinc-cadmium resistance protein CzcA